MEHSKDFDSGGCGLPVPDDVTTGRIAEHAGVNIIAVAAQTGHAGQPNKYSFKLENVAVALSPAPHRLGV